MSASLPYRLSGETVRGKRLGSRLGYPTANLAYPPVSDLPPDGVYIASAALDHTCYRAILNQGRHPTAPEGQATVEAHLLGYDGGDLYGRPLTLTYLAYLRPEQRFLTLAALKAQLTADEAAAERWFAAHATDCFQTPPEG